MCYMIAQLTQRSFSNSGSLMAGTCVIKICQKDSTNKECSRQRMQVARYFVIKEADVIIWL